MGWFRELFRHEDLLSLPKSQRVAPKVVPLEPRSGRSRGNIGAVPNGRVGHLVLSR